MNEHYDRNKTSPSQGEEGGQTWEDVSAYSDAYYKTAPRERHAGYGYNPANCYAVWEEPDRPARPRRQVGLGAVIAACLACLLLAGTLGIGGMYFLLREQTSDQAAETQEDSTAEFYAQILSTQETDPLTTVSVGEDDVILTPEEIYPLACRQVVGVTTPSSQYNIFGQATSNSVSGSGIVLTEDGYILTNYHVIQSAYESGYTISVILYGGDTYEAQVIGSEADSDLAVLHIDAEGLEPAVLGDSSALVVGQTIYAVGNPLGELTYTMTSGIVSALDRLITTDENVTVNMFQFDAAVNSGNSGGPLYNAYGQVIGVVTAKYSESGMEGLGFAIPISDACYIANELINNGYVSGKAYMGLTPTTVSPSVAQYYNMVQGVYVYAVEEGSAADNAGLKTGDIITAIDGTTLTTASQLVEEVKNYRAGDSAQLTVFRSQVYITVTIVFDEELPAQSTEETVPTVVTGEPSA